MTKYDYAEQNELKKKRNYRNEALASLVWFATFLIAVWFIWELTA